jgi:chromosomal replication initiation ATPase DnaA
MEKIDILVRFANEGVYYNTVSVDPKKIKDPMVFIDEVFITIDDVRVAIKKEDWNKIKSWVEIGKKELRKILIKNNMSEEYIEETLEYTDDERIPEPVITKRFGKLVNEEEKKDLDIPSCWSNLKNNEYAPAYPTVPKVPAGVYEIGWNSNLSTYTVKKQPFKTDELYHLPSYEITDILKDIDNFWNRADNYKKYNYIHKRGILMYGEPGCGKSGIIQLISQQIIEKDGIVINVKDEEDVERFTSFIATFRKVEPNRPLIVLLEDIDSLAGEGRHQTARLLNILDGVKQIEGVVYIATTNYPEKLQDRITNRPSRFDRRYKVELPNADIRRAYVQHKLSEDDLKGIDIEEWIKKTEGMSLSHLKEVVISVIVMGRTFEETIENLEGLKKTPTIKGGGKVGFGN